MSLEDCNKFRISFFKHSLFSVLYPLSGAQRIVYALDGIRRLHFILTVWRPRVMVVSGLDEQLTNATETASLNLEWFSDHKLECLVKSSLI